MKSLSFKNEYIFFLPLLLIYVLICLIKQQNILVGDEDDYLLYADNLTNGFYADPSHEYSYLWNGPGYPLVLAFFKILNFPLLIPKLLNTLFIYLGIVYVFKTLKQFINKKTSFIFALALGLYYPLLVQSIPKLLTEALSFFLVSLFTYSVFSYINKKSKKHKWISISTLGYLVLTKIIFAYVIFGTLIMVLPLFYYRRFFSSAKSFCLILVLGFSLTIPYLMYTFKLTNKLFYYGNSGGMSLYWMSTPFENEFGDWHSFETLKEKPYIYKNHKNFIETIKNLPPIEKDIALKKKALYNIKNNKFKFFKNWLSNIGRLFFDYPHDIQKIDYKFFIYLIPKLIIFIILLFNSIFIFFNFRKLNPIILFLNIFLLVYLGGLSLLSSYSRFLNIVLPIIFVCITYTFKKSIK